MRTLLNSIILLFILSGCSPEKRIARIYAHHPELMPRNSDSIITQIAFECEYDTILVPYQELSFDTSGIIPASVEFHEHNKSGRLSGSIDIKGGKLTFKCAEDSLRQIIEKQNKIITTKDTRKTVVNVPIRDGRYQFFRTGFWISFGLLILFVAGLIFVKER